uniref:hypothetical protein n=1 Tax=Flavobacterium sp. TaxID=239 RepID=UPI004049CE2C
MKRIIFFTTIMVVCFIQNEGFGSTPVKFEIVCPSGDKYTCYTIGSERYVYKGKGEVVIIY